MPVNPKLLRKLFAGGAVLAVLVAAGFYLRGIEKSWRHPGPLPNNIPDTAQQVAQGFKYSKSEGSRTLFTIQAASFQQFKEGQRYELHDASIVLYGREGDRSDQISGSDFEYDKATGDVKANGEVHIDLETNSPVAGLLGGADGPDESIVHLKTSGLTFNEKSGLAQTQERIEFRVPEASGSAIGARYDSRAGILSLKSAVRVAITGRQKATVTAGRATIFRAPERIVMQGATIDQPAQSLATDQLTVLLRPDNTVERILGAGAVHAMREGPKGFDMQAASGELILDDSSQLRSGSLAGGVSFVNRGEQPAQGNAGKMLLSFGPEGRLETVRAEDAVDVKQGTAAKSQELRAAALDLHWREGKLVEKAATSGGPAQIIFNEKGTTSTIGANQFEAAFGGQNRLRSVAGTGNASIVSSTPGHPDRVTRSREVSATFNGTGEITSAEQSGDFRYQEADRKGWAERARYDAAAETYTLTGSPRFADSNRSLTADRIVINRKDSTALAQGHVKSTYNQNVPAGSAVLSPADPVHVTGNTMMIGRNGSARYTAARLWRGQQSVDAPVISFDNASRSFQAESAGSGRVASVFAQPGKAGKPALVNVVSDRLSYVDSDREALFTGNVVVGIEGGATITAHSVQVLLRAPGARQVSGQLDRIVAQDDIHIRQPNREAKGSQLVYTAAEEKFVLTGSKAHPPSIFDAERGQIQGDSLTFFSHDGRVLVGSGESSQSQPQTTVQDASKK